MAGAAGLLCAAASRAMGLEPAAPVVGVAVAGTLVVYNVDRLRDLARDRATSPARSAFVARHRRPLAALTAASALAAALLAAALGARVVAGLAPVAALGLAHRRLKRIPFAKAAYVSAAWLAVTVALPAVAARGGAHRGWTAALLATALLANAIASNVRDREGAVRHVGPGPALHAARCLAAAGVLLAGFAPAAVRPLAAVPGATLAALIPFRDDERYGPLFVDGALVLGGAFALAWGSG